MKKVLNNIIISRTDSIGDVVLTLPIAKVLKDNFPGIMIAFMGKSYTRPVIEACEFIDVFIEVEDFLRDDILIKGEKPEAILHVFPVEVIAKRAKQIGIPLRVGTTNRLYHWLTCNKLLRLSRKNSPLHEAQLNLKLLQAFDIDSSFELPSIAPLLGLTNRQVLPQRFSSLNDTSKYNLILHPKSQGSAREWGVRNFIELVQILDKERFNILISGTDNERALLNELFDKAGNHVTDITGLMTLTEFISFIAHCDGIVANSTGPLHIAAAMGKDALGIYPPIRPMHPGRWAPIGQKAQFFVLDKECSDCRKDEGSCVCIKQVLPQQIKSALDKAASIKFGK